jgi:hypothetical protein
VSAPSLVSSSPRVRWVEASSERSWASVEGEETSGDAAAPFPLGVPGRIVVVEALCDGAGSFDAA